jgi:hypothetical protein
MKRLQDIKVFVKLMLTIIIFIVGFVVFSLVFSDTMSTIKINDPIYKDIVQSKDLIADILPPPEYIIESYLLV